MELTIDIPDKDLIEFGKATIQLEIQKTLKWMKIKQSYKRISEGLQEIDEKTYNENLSKIRETTWQEYKKDLKL